MIANAHAPHAGVWRLWIVFFPIDLNEYTDDAAAGQHAGSMPIRFQTYNDHDDCGLPC